ncbi:hypothetical protein KCP71_14710 [Salmonella enterica subsp. enterica]|nr:hypothetical protein KCP71_14710 [Salmonella enterica subsp. enterica]
MAKALLVVPEEIKKCDDGVEYFFQRIFYYAWEGNPYANVFFSVGIAPRTGRQGVKSWDIYGLD